jgi:hypothetical protein
MPTRDEFFTASLMQLTIGASFRRVKIYAEDNVSGAERVNVRASLHRLVLSESQKYLDGTVVSNAKHTNAIVRIANELTQEHAQSLYNGRLTIGVAQKALNLYLKYLWCLDRIQPPPHCPFDSKIIAKIARATGDADWKTVRWPTIDSREEYLRLVNAARGVAGKQSLAEWELREFEIPTL